MAAEEEEEEERWQCITPVTCVCVCVCEAARCLREMPSTDHCLLVAQDLGHQTGKCHTLLKADVSTGCPVDQGRERGREMVTLGPGEHLLYL